MFSFTVAAIAALYLPEDSGLSGRVGLPDQRKARQLRARLRWEVARMLRNGSD